MSLIRRALPAQVEAFAKGLQPHQKARTTDGSTVLERAVVIAVIYRRAARAGGVLAEGLQPHD